jgi:hypothetical protein
VVIDGSSVLLTPFRSMNVPPPMAGFTFDLSAPSTAGRKKRRTPACICLVPGSGLKDSLGTETGASAAVAGGVMGLGERTSEVLALLWSGGDIEMWELGTRVGPGRGKVVRPELVWRGSVVRDLDQSQRGEEVEWREIVAVRYGDDGDGKKTKGKGWRVGVLGYARIGTRTVEGEGADVMRVLSVGAEGDGDAKVEELEERKLNLAGSGWRFVRAAESAGAHGALALYDKKGRILQCESPLLCYCFLVDICALCS